MAERIHDSSDAEIAEGSKRALGLVQVADEIHVVFHNNCRDFAPVAAEGPSTAPVTRFALGDGTTVRLFAMSGEEDSQLHKPSFTAACSAAYFSPADLPSNPVDQPPSLLPVLIAIDGPAASGKSTVARTLATRLGYGYVNSGAFYRAVTWFVLEHGVDPHDSPTVAALLDRAKVHCWLQDGASIITFDGVDPEPFLRATRINAFVSTVASIPEIRAGLTAKLRDLAGEGNTVMEGRDIGSAVFPQTPYKFYIDASPEVRAQRRQAQEGGGPQHDQILARDYTDSTRRTSPLVIAEDAFVIDSSRLTIDGVVGEAVGRLKLKGLSV